MAAAGTGRRVQQGTGTHGLAGGTKKPPQENAPCGGWLQMVQQSPPTPTWIERLLIITG